MTKYHKVCRNTEPPDRRGAAVLKNKEWEWKEGKVSLWCMFIDGEQRLVEEATKTPGTTFKADSLRLIFKRGLSGERFWPSGRMLNVKPSSITGCGEDFEATAGSEHGSALRRTNGWLVWLNQISRGFLSRLERGLLSHRLPDGVWADLKMDPKYSGCLNQTLVFESPLWL